MVLSHLGSDKFVVDNYSSCNTQSYEMPSCFKFSIIFLSLPYWHWLLYLRWIAKVRRGFWNDLSIFRLWTTNCDNVFIGRVWETAPWIFGPYKIKKINWCTTGSMSWRPSLNLPLDVIPFLNRTVRQVFATFASRRASSWKLRSFTASLSYFWILCQKSL